ncbi:hypothetical protein ACHAQH_005542 [Verticillium albo-atrum]
MCADRDRPLLALLRQAANTLAPPSVGPSPFSSANELSPRQYSGPEKMPLSGHQVTTIIALERTGASLSLIGITLIFVTYYLFKRLRTIPNLFIVFASVANIGASIACLIGYDGILIGEASALCQAQAFMLQMFMQSDPWWSLAMAVNVYLVFFFGASPASFRQYLWLYCVICFGGPFIPAIVLLLARPNGQMMYGNATLWCWINADWSELRIYTYYLPIWICILCSILIYFAVGYHVFHQRNQLRNLTFSNIKDANEVSLSEDNMYSAEKNLTGRSEDWQVTAVTEVQITTGAPSHTRQPDSPTVPSAALTDPPHIHGAGPVQSWHSSIERAPSRVANHARFETMISSSPPPLAPRKSLLGFMRSGLQKFNAKLQGLDPVKLAYLRTSFIFAISILVTWTPSSINRVNDLVNPGQVSFGLNVATAIVLPLQGVWNAVIYFMTSWTTVKEEYHRVMHLRSARRLESRGNSRLGGARIDAFRSSHQDHFDAARLDRGKRPGSDETSEFELTPPMNFSHDNIRAMRGAGPSGLVAAKTLLYNAPKGAFKVTIFDAQKRIGGLWPVSRDDASGLVHPLMTTNQSRHTMHFSDFGWEDGEGQFPRAWMVGRYLERYLARYPGAEVRLGWRVTETALVGDGGWRVTVRNGEGAEEVEVFDRLLVTTGFFGEPVLPKGITDGSTVPVVHSSRYRDLKGLLGKGGKGGKILVVGGQMSGVEIAGTIASHLSSATHASGTSDIAGVEAYTIHHLVQHPAWVFPLYTTPKPKLAAPPFLPVDLGSYNLNNRPKPLTNTQGHISPETAKMVHGIFHNAVGQDQSQFSESIAVKGDLTTEPPYLAMSEYYTEFVRSGLITASRGKLQAMDGTTATVTPSGERVDDVAAVVLATGFDPSPCVSFLPESVLKSLQHSPQHRDLPLALGFHGTQHRDLPTLGFVGFYRSPYWGVMEMQARFLAALWTPESLATPPPGLAAAVQSDTCEKRILDLRDDPRCSQFPFGDYAFIMQEMATALEIPMSPPVQPPTPTLPHNNLPMDILTSSRYLSPLADEQAKNENAKVLQYTNEVATTALTSSRFVAHAVFRSLLGTWRLERSLDSKLPSHPSGHFSGTARFLLRDATTDGLQCASSSDKVVPSPTDAGDPGQEYLYVEEGEFKASNGLVFQARRRYIWRYDEGRDSISVWFVRTDDDKRADYLFHEVEFEARGADGADGADDGGPWRAKAGHLCIDDFYNVAYEFAFAAVNLREWAIGYAVQGPKKDYAIRGVYRREARE